jgi:CheY-like chemotaxis protein
VELAGTRVLVVEDEAIIAMMMEEFLTELGCEVAAVASRLEDAEGKARTCRFDIATLDINLAGQVSYPVATILGSRGIPFIFATGYGLVGLPAELTEVPVLSKPFSMEALGLALRAAKKI